MKKSIRNLALLLTIASALFCSCDSYTDIHKKYTEDGERLYAVKLDSLIVYPGKERVVLGCWLYNAVLVDSIFVYWNIRKDTLAVQTSFKSGLDSLEIVIPNLGESAFTFDVRTKDRLGNWSLFTTGTGASYGEEFQNSLSDRTIVNAVMQGANGVIKWGSSDETLLRTELKYYTVSGEEVEAEVPVDEIETICENIDNTRGLSYRSLYLPEELSVDIFYTNWNENIIFSEILDRMGWEIVQVTSELGGYDASYMLDGNMNSFWHTLYGTGAPPLPHYVTIDMKEEKVITGLNVYQRLNNHQVKSFRLHLSDDNQNWESGGAFSFQSNAAANMDCLLYKPFTCRYIQFEFYESYTSDGSCAIAEVYVYGKK